ncbi:MAG: hypothetical protein J5956_05690 [Ruminococcus sp.]|nr:hypothetical protein [Ruminococcus sp.]
MQSKINYKGRQNCSETRLNILKWLKDPESNFPPQGGCLSEPEIIGSWNERFEYTDDDIDAYLSYAEKLGYKHIILAGHSLGANKVIYYMSRPLIREPDLIDRWQSGDCSPAKCVSCNMCYRTPAHKCIFRLRGIE